MIKLLFIFLDIFIFIANHNQSAKLRKIIVPLKISKLFQISPVLLEPALIIAICQCRSCNQNSPEFFVSIRKLIQQILACSLYIISTIYDWIFYQLGYSLLVCRTYWLAKWNTCTTAAFLCAWSIKITNICVVIFANAYFPKIFVSEGPNIESNIIYFSCINIYVPWIIWILRHTIKYILSPLVKLRSRIKIFRFIDQDWYICPLFCCNIVHSVNRSRWFWNNLFKSKRNWRLLLNHKRTAVC